MVGAACMPSEPPPDSPTSRTGRDGTSHVESSPGQARVRAGGSWMATGACIPSEAPPRSPTSPTGLAGRSPPALEVRASAPVRGGRPYGSAAREALPDVLIRPVRVDGDRPRAPERVRAAPAVDRVARGG